MMKLQQMSYSIQEWEQNHMTHHPEEQDQIHLTLKGQSVRCQSLQGVCQYWLESAWTTLALSSAIAVHAVEDAMHELATKQAARRLQSHWTRKALSVK